MASVLVFWCKVQQNTNTDAMGTWYFTILSYSEGDVELGSDIQEFRDGEFSDI
jgi:hypothetical protein